MERLSKRKPSSAWKKIADTGINTPCCSLFFFLWSYLISEYISSDYSCTTKILHYCYSHCLSVWWQLSFLKKWEDMFMYKVLWTLDLFFFSVLWIINMLRMPQLFDFLFLFLFFHRNEKQKPLFPGPMNLLLKTCALATRGNWSKPQPFFPTSFDCIFSKSHKTKSFGDINQTISFSKIFSRILIKLKWTNEFCSNSLLVSLNLY